MAGAQLVPGGGHDLHQAARASGRDGARVAVALGAHDGAYPVLGNVEAARRFGDRRGPRIGVVMAFDGRAVGQRRECLLGMTCDARQREHHAGEARRHDAAEGRVPRVWNVLPERYQPATVLASVKGKAAPAAMRPPLTFTVRDGRPTGDRVGGMIRDPTDQRDEDHSGSEHRVIPSRRASTAGSTSGSRPSRRPPTGTGRRGSAA